MKKTHQNAEYYGNVRSEIIPLLPKYSPRALEVGCGTGATLLFIKEQGYAGWVGGIDLYADDKNTAEKSLDYFRLGSIEQNLFDIPEASIDLLLCLDVLEHLVNPWQALARLSTLLKPGGVLVTSIPNIRHFKALVPLLFRGEWNYSNDGLLDRTHLRFFTKSSAVELVQQAGFTIDTTLYTGLAAGSRASLINKLTLNIFRQFFQFQYLIKAYKTA